MTRPDPLLSDDWNRTIERLGGAEALAMGARNTKAFAWGRKVPSPIVLLRLVLAYCLGKCSLRSTTAWATAIGLADISNVALLYRLCRCGDWLALLVGHLLAMRTPKASRGRLIRIIDASSVPKAGRAAKRENGVWRIHSAFDLPSERFGQFVLTDEHGGEQLDRIAVVRGEIRLADRVHLQPDRIANVLADGGDVGSGRPGRERPLATAERRAACASVRGSMAERAGTGSGAGIRAAEFRTGRGVPVRLEPRDDHAPGAAADDQGGAHEAVAQPDAVRARLFPGDPGTGV